MLQGSSLLSNVWSRLPFLGILLFCAFEAVYANDCALRLRGVQGADLAEGLCVVVKAALRDDAIPLRRVVEFANSEEWYNLFEKADESLLKARYLGTFADLSADLDEDGRKRAKEKLRNAISIQQADVEVSRVAAEATAKVLAPSLVEKFELPGMTILDSAEVTVAIEETRPILIAEFVTKGTRVMNRSGVAYAFDPFNRNAPHVRIMYGKNQPEFTQSVAGVDYSVLLDQTQRKIYVKNLATGEGYKPIDVSTLGHPYSSRVLLYKANGNLLAVYSYQPSFDAPKTQILNVATGQKAEINIPSAAKFWQLIEAEAGPLLCLSPVEERRAVEGLHPICFDGATGKRADISASSLLSNLSTTEVLGYPALLWGGENSITIYDARKKEEILISGNYGEVRRIFGFELNGESYAFIVSLGSSPELVRLKGRSRP